MFEASKSAGTECGSFIVLPDFPSEYVQSRNVSIWLPPGYEREPAHRCRVLYAHDGQNLFDPATSYLGVDWGVHETLGRLLQKGAIGQTLVVGIWNTPERYREYDPRKVFADCLTPEEKAGYRAEFGEPLGDRYLDFIVRELKPYIDERFWTAPGRDDCLLLGSSMGGIISVYALCQYPEVFGGAACLSTHWPTCRGKMVDYLAAHLPNPQSHRIYYDYGTETIDAGYEPCQQRVDEAMRKHGYLEGDNWVTRKFPGADHSERAWRERLEIPLEYLLR